MNNCPGRENPTVRRIVSVACVSALAAALTVALPQPAHARHVTPPPVPDQDSGASGEQGVPRGSRVRHPELRLSAFRVRRRLDIVRAAGHLVQWRRRRAGHHPLPQPQSV